MPLSFILLSCRLIHATLYRLDIFSLFSWVMSLKFHLPCSSRHSLSQETNRLAKESKNYFKQMSVYISQPNNYQNDFHGNKQVLFSVCCKHYIKHRMKHQAAYDPGHRRFAIYENKDFQWSLTICNQCWWTNKLCFLDHQIIGKFKCDHHWWLCLGVMKTRFFVFWFTKISDNTSQ